MDEDEAQRLFDRLGAGVPDDRPHLSEFVIAARQERTQEGPLKHRVLIASIAAGLVLIGGGAYAATLLVHHDSTPTPSTRPGTTVTADQLSGQWADASGTTLRFLPDVGERAGSFVEYVDATSTGSIELLDDGRIQVSGTPDASDPLGSTSSIQADGDSLRLLDDSGHEVGVLTPPPVPPTVPPTGQVTSVNQITGTWDAVDLVGVRPSDQSQLVVTVSWLAARVDCTAWQSDYELGTNGTVTTHDFAETAGSGCPTSVGLVSAVMGQAASLTLNDGVLGVYDAGDIEIAQFTRSPRPDHVDNPVGTWTPAGATDAQLQLTAAQGKTSGRVIAHEGDCAVSGIWYLTSDGTFVSSVEPTATSEPGCDQTAETLHDFENIDQASLDHGRLTLVAPDGQVVRRYDRVG